MQCVVDIDVGVATGILLRSDLGRRYAAKTAIASTKCCNMGLMHCSCDFTMPLTIFSNKRLVSLRIAVDTVSVASG